jgi:protein-S-isoprenylcysteine O-methyltransferase Ste14
MEYLLLVLLWGAWCALHSAMISPAVTGFLRRRFPGPFRYYRLVFNLVAVGTLIPVLLYSHALRKPVMFAWEGPWRALQLLLIASALLLFAGGARRYDLRQFLGLRQLRNENTCSVLTDDCRLDTAGVLGWVRHPWYTGGILIVWARPLDISAVLTNTVLCVYFIVGAYLEERKLVAQFGREYETYRNRVSMLVPIKKVKTAMPTSTR